MIPVVLLRSIISFARRLFPVLFMLALLAPAARADTIVYTGEGPRCCSGLSLFSGQWMAGAFTVEQGYIVTSVEGWIAPVDSGNLTVRLYGDGDDIPGAPLFSVVAPILATPLFQAKWTGATSLRWLIDPGTYWAAFEVRDGSTFEGAMPFPSPNPVVNEAIKLNIGSQYFANDSLDLGFRVLGDPVQAPTPEPATLVLLGTAAIGIGGRAWRRRRAT
jgi:PEP-CTERM motif